MIPKVNYVNTPFDQRFLGHLSTYNSVDFERNDKSLISKNDFERTLVYTGDCNVIKFKDKTIK